ncbi:MAG: Mov34/MPN/PAD-1 family protein [Acidimicrobiales bacterium]
MLQLTADVRAAMVAHALRGLPHEACGLFSGPQGDSVATVFHPMTNIAASSELYQLDGVEMMGVERRVDDAGHQILGVMHSHTHTSAYPSPTDVRDASAFDPFGTFHYVIVSLKHADPVLRSYRITDGEIAEERLLVALPG